MHRCVRPVVLFTGAVLLIGTLAPGEALAWRGLAIVTGARQGTILGDNTSKDLPGAIVIRDIAFGLNVPFDPANLLIIGATRFAPFNLVKEPDRATPMIGSSPPQRSASSSPSRSDGSARWPPASSSTTSRCGSTAR